MSIVVTGSAGFIGSHLVEALAAAGRSVVGIDRRTPPPGLAGTHLIADLSDFSSDVVTALEEAECVFHLAGAAGVRSSVPDIERIRRRDNVEATRTVLAATPRSTPLVVTSSSSVYGGARRTGRGLRPSREGDPLRPRGGYARSKVAVEQMCARRAALGGSVAIARPFTVAGERQRPDMAISRWLETARRGAPLVVLGSVDRVRDVTDVRDVVRALVRMADRQVQGVVNVGTGRGWRLAELVEAVAEAVGVPVRIRTREAPPQEVRATLASTDRCRELLGFVPRTDLRGLVERQARAELVEVPA